MNSRDLCLHFPVWTLPYQQLHLFVLVIRVDTPADNRGLWVSTQSWEILLGVIG